MVNPLISWQDCAVFAFSLLLSVGTGIYHAIHSYLLLKNNNVERRTAKDEYMMGGRKLPKLPVALSLLTTFLSGILMLGVPAEMFQRGAHIWLNFVIGAVSSLITVLVFLPVFYKLKCTCIHEYFIHRYNSKLLRQSFSVIFLFFTVVYMAVVIYAPSVAMSSVLGIDKWMLILTFGFTATAYTTIGGLKAVVWTDALQAVMMYGGVFVLIFKGLLHPQVGGLNRVLSIAYDSGRIDDLFRFSPTIAQYNSFWINVFGGTVTWLASFGVNQLAIQRYNSLPALSDAKSIVYSTLIPFIVLCSIVAFVGFIALAYFYNCNPLETGEIADKDHLTILFALEILSSTPGLFGLYIACIMSATLSTLSSGINSSAAAIYEDFVQYKVDGSISDKAETTINKLLVLGVGVLSTLLAFAAGPLGGTLTVCISVMGAVSGPMVAIFVIAMFFPKAGIKSTFLSFAISNFIMICIYIFSYYEQPYAHLLFPTNTTIEGCGHDKFNIQPQPPYDAHFGDPKSTYMGRISTYAYAGLGFVINIVLGVILGYVLKEQPLKNIEHLTFKGRHLPMPYSEDRLPQSLENEKLVVKIKKTKRSSH
uniref:Sodium-coupled monocarboxylate transporter 1 n=1 Tax=Panagrolaimus sp. ES5 TaxID=591445 RepID=A0AC34GV26_9BILA